MAMTDRMKEARIRKGLTQEKLAKEIGVAKSTYTGYEKGNSEPNMLVLSKIMRVLDVDANYLLQDEMDSLHDVNATPEEMENLVKKYRLLDPYGKEAVGSVLDVEWRRCKEEEDKKEKIGEARRQREQIEAAMISPEWDNIIPFRQSIQPASAGTGTYLGPEEFEIIQVQLNDLTNRKGVFGVPVQGNSMEPTYHDGDILIIEPAEDVPVGKIGLFTMEGSGYVKVRGEDSLISLNPNYEPVLMREDIRCNGRVIGVLNPEWISKNAT